MLITYAQNHEDVILHRALGHIADGCYVDVGANDPENDSVTKVFYDRGWRGINIEPVASYHERLKAERPGDLNLQVCVAENAGMVKFYELPETGLSSIVKPLIARHEQARDCQAVEHLLPALTLNHILDSHPVEDIHFLKIDVEGAEQQVVRSIDLSRHRPWVILIESISADDQCDSYLQWESDLTVNGYHHVYSDGINRYYLDHRHEELRHAFRHPPNICDNFTSSRLLKFHGRMCQLLQELAPEDPSTRSAIDDPPQDEYGYYVGINRLLDLIGCQCSRLHEQSDAATAQHQHLIANVRRLAGTGFGDELCSQAELERLVENIVSARTEDRDLIAVQKRQIDALRIEINEAWRVAATFEQTLKSVKKSASWRITSPLRELRRTVVKVTGWIAYCRPAKLSGWNSVRNRLKDWERRFRRWRRGEPQTPQLSIAQPLTLARPLSPRAVEVSQEIRDAITRKQAS